MSQDQSVLENKSEIYIDYGPFEPQRLAHASNAKFRLYGGAAGGGKSHWIRNEALAIALELPKAKILVLRRTYPELMGSIITPFKSEVPSKTKDGKVFYLWNGQDKTITFPHNGSVIQFGSAQYENDIYKYDGIEYDAILVDELTHFTY